MQETSLFVGILDFMSSWNFVLSCVEHEKKFYNIETYCMLCFTGLGVEGIFRVNGNARIVEKLKTSFDLHGDANLDEDNDILAVAGVLKQFLREMPDSVVPEHMTRQFVNVQEGR